MRKAIKTMNHFPQGLPRKEGESVWGLAGGKGQAGEQDSRPRQRSPGLKGRKGETGILKY